MNSIEQNAVILSSFGLTVKQAKVYLALVFLGTALVGELSKLSKVRREEVYRILPKLEKMGLIEKTLTSPVKLKATSVESALSLLIRNEEENAKQRISELKIKKEEFLEHYRTSSRNALGNNEQFSFISEKAAALGKIESLIEKSHRTIDYCVSRKKLLQFLKFFAVPLREAVERGVKVRVISNPSEKQDEIPPMINQILSGGSTLSLRYVESIPNHFMVFDGNEVLVATDTMGYLAANPLLWSSNPPHVSGYKKLFEELWNSSVETVALNVEGEVEKLKSVIKQMKPSDHTILLYETTDAKFKILLNYVKYALDNNEAFVYVCSESSVEEVKVAMQQFGIDVEAWEDKGALKVLDYTQHYIIDGQFKKEVTMELWKRYLDEALSKGLTGLRVTGETACFFKHNMLKELVDYERSLHKQLDLPMVAICAYRADQLMKPNSTVNLYNELVKAHGNVLFTWVDKELGRIAIS